VIRTFRGPVVALLALVLALSAPVTADAVKASRVPPDPDAGLKTFTHSEAKDVLANARSMLRGRPGKAAARPSSGDLTMTLRDLYLARPSLAGPDRRAANRLLSRDTAAAKVQTSAAAAAQKVTCSTHFCLHYNTSRTTAPWASTTLSTLEHVWGREVPFMGRAPLPDNGDLSDPDNPNDKLDVFLRNLQPQRIYGYCAADGPSNASQVPAFCVLDDDYVGYGTPPTKARQVTAAHEFFHAIQFSWDIGEDLWFMEGTAVWMEDYVYDSVNDNYQYLATSPIRNPRTSLDYAANTFPYGSFIFFTYASERRGAAVIRDFWEAAVGQPTSLQAIYGVVGAAAWSRFFATFGSWNTLPLHSYSERASYPTPAWDLKKTLTARSTTTGRRTPSISHLGNSATLVTPGSKLRAGKRLLVEIDGPNKSLHPAALLQRRYRDGHVTHTLIALNAAGNGRTLVQFNRKLLNSIVVVLSNTNRYGAVRTFRMRASLR